MNTEVKIDASLPGGPYLPEVRLSSLDGRPIISIDEEAAYLDVGRRGQEWTFSLRDQRTPPIVKTSWVTLDEAELLRTSPHAVVIREELERLYPEAWRLILDAAIGLDPGERRSVARHGGAEGARSGGAGDGPWHEARRGSQRH